MKQSNTILKSEGLSIGYTSKKKIVTIQEGLDIVVKKSRLIALLGKNGIGKSTLIRTLLGMQPSLAGSIELLGRPLHSYSSAEIAQKVAVVLTEPIPENNLTVYELIALGRQPYTNWVGRLSEEDKNQIDVAIRNCQVENFINKKHFELSDGQRQRVMIARALAQNTELIILDEPTAHLDMQYKLEVFDLLETLVRKFGKTILFSSHEVPTALAVADELWLLKNSGLSTGATEALIASNEISKLFDSSRLIFDVKTKQFTLKS